MDLKKQLERTRFERALEVAESIAEHKHVLNTQELAGLNHILTGHGGDYDPWRSGPVTLVLPTGRTETMALVADPKVTAREKLYSAAETAETGDFLEAALQIYVSLVLAHVFKDANRRTAVLAAHYHLKRHDLPLSAVALHEMVVGDLRDAAEVQRLREGMKALLKRQ